ncbi:epidermal retinal dehydrogenase 2-like [Acyrthosiphon pisum]|uniref:Short-chain dehydrogenase/reductase 3 n=1 Tax=Acyrthosiphon pisum TaxID=7029 RepID=C4WXJ5_ACYPI|nr:epidermal retinal dehydrogenase 2-like [Acyrthosiphon pisum]BAH72615.1 ACYPI003892 [Acyrthosiphon pisum]|eukprot:NP_001156151.1 epidermal retinal dehydrogenase 2-like [Acyrthosiphon pisum]
MENFKNKKSITTKSYLKPQNPVQIVLSLFIFILLLLPNYIWAGIKCLMKTRKDVRGQVVLITGSARGLGRELCLTFHQLGASIVCVDIDEEGNEITAEMIRGQGGTVRAFTLDITDREKIVSMHEAVKRELGPVDILVNNAAVVKTNIYVNSETDELVRKIIDVNILGQFWMNKEILPSMLNRNKGHIVSISSLISMIGTHSLSAYTASKWGVTGMMEALDQELNMLNSKVVLTTVCPYFMDSNEDITTNISISFPVIPLNVICNSTVDGILKNKKMFTIPGFLFLAMMFYKILPSKLQYQMQKLLGASYNYCKSDYDTLKKYQRGTTSL